MNSFFFFRLQLLLLLLLPFLLLELESSPSGPSPKPNTLFGFSIHHRYSEPVKKAMGFHALPEMGSPEYYRDMAQRDGLVRGRRHLTSLTFAGGNLTQQNGLGYLYYANVSIGTPPVSFMVALDTGSDLFWLPCVYQDFSYKQPVGVKIYYPNASSTSEVLSCLSSRCDAQWACTTRDLCSYYTHYLSNGTSSSGLLVEDVLHLATENSDRAVDAPITFGCGVFQTGGFLHGDARNGLFGLGMDTVSVPSILANQGIAPNSFSMCFGQDELGRIVLGDKGSFGQAKTPFNVDQRRLDYIITLTQITVEENITKINMTAVFDSGTAFTYVSDPAYSVIVENFNSRIKQRRHPSDPKLLFEYCYDSRIKLPLVNFTMKGGSQFTVKMSLEMFPITEGS